MRHFVLFSVFPRGKRNDAHQKFSLFNPFHANIAFRSLLKMLENLWFSDVFMGYRNETMGWNCLRNHNRVFCLQKLPYFYFFLNAHFSFN